MSIITAARTTDNTSQCKLLDALTRDRGQRTQPVQAPHGRRTHSNSFLPAATINAAVARRASASCSTLMLSRCDGSARASSNNQHARDIPRGASLL